VSEATERMVEHLPWRPGARELLTDLRATDVPCALVTMSWAVQVEPVLHALGDDVFHAVVTGDSVTHGKPHPEPYLTAAAALGLRPEECLAIEDSHTGATSAESAGCTVLCVPNHVPIPPGERRIIADTLAGTSAAALLAYA
jgi:HAD superfamily hydrolase (TIGR01509 family)